MVALVIAEQDNATLKCRSADALAAAIQWGGDVHVLVGGAQLRRRCFYCCQRMMTT